MSDNIFSSEATRVGFNLVSTGGNINTVRFSALGGTELKATDAFLADTVSVGFNRGLNYKYFLNRENPAAIVGRPNGTLAIQGLFGNREAFLRIFGNADNAGSGVANNVCDQFTVAIQCGTLVSCDSEDNKKFAIVNAFLLSGVIPVGISMSNSIDQNGVMYTTANAAFQFTGLRIVNDSANA